MISEHKQELLCISQGQKNYVVELSYVVEICFDLPILKIPRLPEYFQGVCNYKGVAVPVVVIQDETFMESKRNSQNEILVILKTEKYQFGVLVDREPFIISLEKEEQVEDYTSVPETSRWEEKKVFYKENEIYLLLDLEKTADNLVAYK